MMNEGDHSGTEVLRLAERTLSRVTLLNSLVTKVSHESAVSHYVDAVTAGFRLTSTSSDHTKSCFSMTLTWKEGAHSPLKLLTLILQTYVARPMRASGTDERKDSRFPK